MYIYTFMDSQFFILVLWHFGSVFIPWWQWTQAQFYCKTLIEKSLESLSKVIPVRWLTWTLQLIIKYWLKKVMMSLWKILSIRSLYSLTLGITCLFHSLDFPRQLHIILDLGQIWVGSLTSLDYYLNEKGSKELWRFSIEFLFFLVIYYFHRTVELLLP